MFTGIIETLGKVTSLEAKGGNLDITIESNLTSELKIDQSVAHNGVCLTVVSLTDTTYTVTAIAETLSKTNLDTLKTNDTVNLERAMILGSRLDGHIVQGHVDQTGECTSVKEDNGSWIFSFTYDAKTGNPTIEKGSITIDGVSLTVNDVEQNTFCVNIIPFTWSNTCFRSYKEGSIVNIEIDILARYLEKLNKNI